MEKNKHVYKKVIVSGIIVILSSWFTGTVIGQEYSPNPDRADIASG